MRRGLIPGCLFAAALCFLLYGMLHRVGEPLPPAPPGRTVAPQAPQATVAPSAPAVAAPVAVSPAPRVAAPPVVTSAVHFGGHSFAVGDPARVGARLHAFRQGLRSAEPALALVALTSVPDAGDRAGLRERGVELLSYVPDQGWVTRLHHPAEESEAADEVWARHAVTVFEPLAGALKADPDLALPAAGGEVGVYVHLAPGAEVEAARQRLWRAGFAGFGLHEGGVGHYLAGRVAAGRVPDLVSWAGSDPDVTYVARGRGARLMNTTAMRILQSGSYTGATPLWAAGLYGSNQVVAVLDTGLDVDHCYFRDGAGTRPPTNRVDGTNVNRSLRKVIAADFLYAGDNPLTATHWDNNGHGTHVAGHAAGAHLDTPLSNHVQNGMAPGAFVIAQDAGYTGSDNCADLIGLGCPVTNFLPALRQAYLQGARLHNNSWGDNENGVFTNRNAYTQASRDLDAVTWSHRDFLVVCAAGNDYSNDQVASPSNAKNGLSVAASGNGAGQEGMASFSSRGWAQDGRIKPDLAAPGDNVVAALSDGSIVSSNCATTGGGGTSYASPLVAGLGALVRDYFASGFHPGGVPAASNETGYVSAALVKAVLIHSCMAMSNAVASPPARDQGWGRVQLSRALAISNSAQRLRVWDEPLPLTATPAQPFVRYFEVQGTSVPFKATLVWSDYPGTPGASRQLVNDLDLRVQTAAGLFRGNVWTGGWSAAGGSPDRTNNVEQVAWRVPSTGLVEVSVWAHLVPEATQHFALVVSGDAQEIPRELDQDADLLPDFWERWHFGTLAATQGTNDFDGDGQRDAEECVAGTEPTNASSWLAFQQAELNEAGAVALYAPAVAGRLYQVRLADGAAVSDGQAFVPYSNLAVGVGTQIAGYPESNAAVVFVDTFTATNSGGPDLQGGRLYRLHVQAPP